MRTRLIPSTVIAVLAASFLLVVESSAAQPARGQTHTLTVHTIGRDGRPTTDAEILLAGLDNETTTFMSPKDTPSVRLPEGKYTLIGDHVDRDSNWHRLVAPTIDLSKDLTITVDTRTTRPVNTTVERRDARTAAVDIGFDRRHDGRLQNFSLGGVHFGQLYTANIGPSVTAEEMTAGISSAWGVPGRNGDFKNTPYTYNLLDTSPGSFFTGFNRRVADRELATLTAQHYTQGKNRMGVKGWFGMAPGYAATTGTMLPMDLPSTVEHLLDTHGTQWSGAFGEQVVGADGFARYSTAMGSDYRLFEAGKSYTQRWNAGVFGPFLFRADHTGRKGDRMWFGVPIYTDQDDHRAGSVTDSASIKLYRNGVQVGQSAGGQLTADVPPGKARFDVRNVSERPSAFALSTKIDTTWSFTSDTTPEPGAPLPIWVVRYFPQVDEHNITKNSPVLSVPVSVSPHPEAKVGTPGELKVSFSADEGKTWQRATVVPADDGRFTAQIAKPRGAKALSLRAEFADSNGNAVDQTIIRALRFSESTADTTAAPAEPAPSCLAMPSTPEKSASGYRVSATAHNKCSTPNTFWLVRYDKAKSAWHTISEVVLMPGASLRNDWYCRGSGTYDYRAVLFDPNMLFNAVTPTKTISC